MKDKIAAIYIRVSTDAQAEEGYSIDAQKEQLTAYCVSKNIKKYKYYIDGGWSGSNIDRPEMKRLIEDAKAGKLSHCIVYKLDRLSRSQKDTLYLIEDVFNPNGVDFVSMNESMDTSSPVGKLMLGILSAFAQLERENIRIRTRMGMQERVKQGYWMGGGRVPFGYDYDSSLGVLVPNKDAEKVKQIYDLYIKGYSAQKISDILGLKYDRLTTQILTRKTNYGIIEYNGKEYQGKHEPIVSKETYDLAMLEMNKRSNSNLTTSSHLLTGLVYCGKCGAKFRYQKWGKKGYKLVCYSQQTSKPYLIKDANCDQDKPWADDIERETLSVLFSLKEKERVRDINNSDNSTLAILTKQKDEIERKIKRLYNLYAESDDDILLDTITENKKALEKINENINIEETQKNNIKTKKKMSPIIYSLEEKWDYMTIKEQQNIIRILVDKIIITDDNIEVKLNI